MINDQQSNKSYDLRTHVKGLVGACRSRKTEMGVKTG